MRKYLLLSLMALLPMAALITVTSCGDDDEIVQPPVNNNANNDKDNPSGNNGENLDIHVIVNDDGTTSNGSIFSAIDNQNFYVDYIKYTVTEGHLAVSGYDKTGFKGIAKIISKLTYKGNTYEVLEIKESSFRDCTSLTAIIIPSSVTSIGSSTFDGCTSLTSIVVESGNTVYDSRNDCNAIIKTATNTLIGGCKNTTIPNSVTSIGNYAFYGCSSMTSITIPNSVTSIGYNAFYYCTNLTSVTLESNSIVSESRNKNSSMKSVFGEQVKTYVIGNEVTNIGSDAFYGCSSLTSITIPNSVTSIGYNAFYGCSGMTSVHITDIATWCKISFGGASANPLTYANHLYMNGQEITVLVIPNSVTSIGSYAFQSCKSLTSVTIPNSVTSIGEYAFSYCTRLTSVTIPNSVTNIGNMAFYACGKLTALTIGTGITGINYNVFALCPGLKDVFCHATNPPSTYSSFDDTPISSATLHVPAGSVDAYKAREPWKNFGTIVAIE